MYNVGIFGWGTEITKLQIVGVIAFPKHNNYSKKATFVGYL